ncbi:MAG: TetR family transcriptional regulator [Acidimicrobiaceae bacterium]|nr:TetR family transcriptional regulator [Acidimicrobiaceae bacterium]
MPRTTSNAARLYLNSRSRRRLVPPRSSAVRPDDPPAVGQIISAAVATMAENGYHGTSVRDIADAAGVSAANIYHYFGSKQGLLLVVMERGIDSLYAATLDALYAAPHDPVARLNAIVGVHVSGHLQARREAFIGTSELRSLEPEGWQRIVSKRDQQEHLFDQVVQDGVNEGVFRTLYPREASRAIVTMCSAVSGWYNPKGPISIEEMTARYQQLALAVVGYRDGN